MRTWSIRVLRQARPPAGSVAGVLALILCGAAIDALKPWPLKWLVDHVLRSRGAVGETNWTQLLPGASSPAGVIAYLALATVALFVVGQFVRMMQNYLQNGLGARATYALGARLFDQLQNLSLLFHTNRPTGDLVRRITIDSACVRDLLLSVLFPIITSVSTLAIMLVVMWRLDRALALVAILVAVPLGMFVKLLYRPMSEGADAQEAAQSEQLVLAERTLGAVSVVQLFGQEESNLAAYRDAAGRSTGAYLRTIVSQLQFKIGTGGVTAMGTAAVMLVGGRHVLSGSLSLGGLLVFLSYLSSLYAPLEALAYVSTAFASAGASGRRVVEILDSQERVKERPHATALWRPAGGSGFDVSFEAVTFGYQPGAAVLRDVTLTIPPGKTLALVGRTGAGKTTLAALLPRLVDPWSGCVRVGGHDVSNLTLASLREQIAIVPQEPLLLPLSIRENIAYGRRDATAAQVEAAADAAQATEFINQLPRGFETVLGERGCTLSAGQRQRLAIARALVRDAPVLILDEPTSALDVNIETLIVQALRRLTSGRTCMVIAHRLSTVRDADLVAVLDEGRVVEFGPPAELLRAGGSFARFHDLQIGGRHETAASTLTAGVTT